MFSRIEMDRHFGRFHFMGYPLQLLILLMFLFELYLKEIYHIIHFFPCGLTLVTIISMIWTLVDLQFFKTENLGCISDVLFAFDEKLCFENCQCHQGNSLKHNI